MDTRRCTTQRLKLLGVAGLAVAALAGCSGNDGTAGPAGQASVQTVAASSTTALNITVTGVTVSGAPVVTFRVTDQYGNAATGLTLNDLRFTFAKLTPGANGDPSTWQNYINTTATGAAGTPGAGNVATQGTREGGTTGAFVGTLVDNGDGTYKYTFKTNVANVTSPLAVTYNPSLTHRVGVQTRGTLPLANGVYTFRPSDGATTGIYQREIVKTAKCNECHNVLQAHDQRIDTRYCVTCHNPGSSDPDTGNTVDFKVMIHKIHDGSKLPSVVAGGSYQIIGFGGTTNDFSSVVFPQDIRNCTKCHDGSDAATPQGDNWKTQPSMQACSSCHDNVNFATGLNHPGGIQTSNSTCLGCHSAGGMAGPVETSHLIAEKVAGAKFKLNLVSVTGGATPVVQFSITDPTNSNAPYNITTDAPFTQVASGVSRIAMIVGWNSTEFTNNTSGTNPAQPITVYPTPTCGGPASTAEPASADWVCTGPVSGVYTLTKQTALPVATGTARIGLEGHPAGQDSTGAWTLRIPVKSVVKDFALSGTLTARRSVVDVAKCDKCHDQLSLHGSNRTDEPQLCVICHNPSDTDVNRRPKTGGVPDTTLAVDGKKMEAIDFKRMIHGIHAAAKTSLNGATTLYGFRNKGIVVYGFGGSVNDFSDVRFPGVLNDCTACHTNTSATSGVGTYELTGIWDPSSSTFGTVLGSTIDAAPTASDATTLATQLADQADDLKISPTAAVCSSCHDGTTSQLHMQSNGALFSDTQATISSGATLEACSLCHGPGRVADVKTVHGIQ